MRYFYNKMDWAEKLAALFLILILIVSIFGTFFAPYPPQETHLLDNNLPPALFGGSQDYLLGTDELGRDILSRLLQATQISMAMAITGMIVGGILGIALGLTAGYFGGKWDKIVITLINIQQSIPYIFFVLVMIVIFGRSIWVILLAVGISGWDTYARYVRSLVLSLKEEEFVDAARSYNASSFRIITKYILPNCISLIIVLLTLNFPSVLLLESSLSFLGIGVQPPTATLGQMVGTGRNFMMTNMWLAFLPSLVIVLISASVMKLGSWLQYELKNQSDIIAEVGNE